MSAFAAPNTNVAWPNPWTPADRSTVQYDATGAPIFRSDAERNMYELVNNFGQRVFGTPNEYNAANYMAAEFEAAGAEDVEVIVTTRADIGSGRLAFAGDLPDIYGFARPDNATWGVAVDAPLVDLGTFPALSVPTGTTGEIIGAIRFNSMGGGAANQFNVHLIAPVLADLEANNPGLTIPHFVLAAQADPAVTEQRTVDVIRYSIASDAARGNTWFGGNRIASLQNAAAATAQPRPFVVTSLLHLEQALERAEHFESIERYVRNTVTSVFARIPAVTDTPDMIILLSAHIDSVPPSQGAADNASGSVGLLEMARRFVDNESNIELRFLGVGGHEGGGVGGLHFNGDRMADAGEVPISINMNMDIASSASPGLTLPINNAISTDIPGVGTGRIQAGQVNLPSYLIVGDALNVWAPGDVGIDTVRPFRFGGSDHVAHNTRGFESASMITVCDCCNDLERGYHQGKDNMEHNYCFYRHSLVLELMANALQRAIDQEITRRAHLRLDTDTGELTLGNATQIWQTFDTLAGEIVVDGTGVLFEIEYPATSVIIPAAVGATTYTFTSSHFTNSITNTTSLRATGAVTPKTYWSAADNAAASRFHSRMVPTEFSFVTFEAAANGTVGEPASVTVTEGGQLVAAQVPATTAALGFRFAHWTSSEHEGTFTSAELLTLVITEDTTFTAVFERIPTSGGGGGFLPPDDDDDDEPGDDDEYRFADVNSDNWFYEAVMFIYESGIMTGTSQTDFAPNATLNRAMVATILHRLEGEPASDAEHGFNDVADGRWYSDAVAWAFENGIVQGITANTFAPLAPITREQFATMLHRYAEFAELDTEVSEDASLDGFVDAYRVGAWAEDAKLWANYNGLITGMTATTLYPQGTTTRAQSATILMRFIQGFDILD